MPLYRVVNASRTLKKCLVADSMDVLKKRAAEKLSLNGQLQVVVDKDGAEVDEDEVLAELQQQCLMVLESNQQWSVELEVLQTVGNDIPNARHSTPQEIYISVQEEEMKTNVVEMNKVAEESIQEPVPVTGHLPIPEFSSLVSSHLKDGKVELVWSKFIEETANFYISHNIMDSSQYKTIGQQMYATYPCIKMESGCYPWTFFTKSLSQKLRHIRHGLKRKSQPTVIQKGCAPKRFKKTFSVVSFSQNNNKESGDEVAHLKELQEEWKKPAKSRNLSHIHVLLDETRSYRLKELKHNTRILKEAVDLVPCFQDGTYLIYELNKAYGKEEIYKMIGNLETVVRASYKLMGKPLKDDTFDVDADSFSPVIEAIHYIETQTKFDRSNKAGNKHFQSAVEILTDVGEDDVPKKLKTTENAPPRLVVFATDGKFEGSFVIGDETVIKCHGDCLLTALLQLVGSYYIFDLDYPKCFAMFLGFLQQFVFGELFMRDTSKKFKFFIKKFRPVFEGMRK